MDHRGIGQGFPAILELLGGNIVSPEPVHAGGPEIRQDGRQDPVIEFLGLQCRGGTVRPRIAPGVVVSVIAAGTVFIVPGEQPYSGLSGSARAPRDISDSVSSQFRIL